MTGYHLEHERHWLSLALKKPELLDEYANIISDKDFSPGVNRPVFQAIRAVKMEKGECNSLLVKEKLRACSARIGDLDAALYVEALELIDIQESAARAITKEIANKTIQRELNQMAHDLVNLTQSKETPNALDLLNSVTSTFNRKVNFLDSVRENEPKDLFKHAEEYIESIGNNPRSDGTKNPYPIMRDMFGDYSVGDMSFIIARPKAGKSTFLLNTLIKCAEESKVDNRRFKTLILDTELEFEREIRRMVSSLSGVGEYWLRTGYWRKNEEMTKKVRAVWKVIKPWYDTLEHIYVGGMKLDEIISIVRRWHGKKVGFNDDTDTIVCLDYIKLGSADDLSGNVKDYQLVGQKVDRHKQLATELRYHCLTAGQANRLNEGRDNDSLVSDGRAVGLSDQISQFASNIYLLQRLSIAQSAMFKEMATHSLLPLYTRNQGPQSQGFNSLVRYEVDGKVQYTDDFLLFLFDNFSVKEIASFRNWVERTSLSKVDLKKASENNGVLPI